MAKKLVAVIFGGPSVEHDISIITGIQVVENLDKSKYDVLPVYWSQDNKFLTVSHFDNPRSLLKDIFKEKLELVANQNERELVAEKHGLFSSPKKFRPDVIIPAMHGTMGEDGGLQGLLEVLNIPYTGSNVGASYLTMDKNAFKLMMKASGVNILPWRVLTTNDDASLSFLRKRESSGRSSIESRMTGENMHFPVIVKPNSLGSSIGVKKCDSLAEVKEALEVVFELDRKALIEPFVTEMMEINCSIMGNLAQQEASVCERPLASGEVLNFEDKYMSGAKGKAKTGKASGGMASLDREIPAKIDSKLAKEIQETCKKVFQVLGCSGLVRVDTIVCKNSEVLVNEVNPIPGSFAFYLWEATGISFRELLDRLINLAEEEFAKKSSLTRRFDTPVLQKFLED